MDNIRINMRGQPCPNCGMVIYPGDWHHCPTENAKSIAKKDNEIIVLRKKVETAKNLAKATKVFINYIKVADYKKANLQMLVVETYIDEIEKGE